MRKPGDGFSIIYTSPSEYEKLCMEIYYDEYFLGEIIQEEGRERAKIHLYPPSKAKGYWDFPLKDLIKCLQNAFEGLDQ